MAFVDEFGLGNCPFSCSVSEPVMSAVASFAHAAVRSDLIVLLPHAVRTGAFVSAGE